MELKFSASVISVTTLNKILVGMILCYFYVCESLKNARYPESGHFITRALPFPTSVIVALGFLIWKVGIIEVSITNSNCKCERVAWVRKLPSA